MTSICTVPGVALVAPLPEQFQLKTAYFAALAADTDAGQKLMHLLFSDDVAAILKRKCIDVP